VFATMEYVDTTMPLSPANWEIELNEDTRRSHHSACLLLLVRREHSNLAISDI